MKHIFKKLHIGSSTTQDSNRSIETASPSLSASCASDHGTTSSAISPTTLITTPSLPATTIATTTVASAAAAASDRSDYFSSEEEFQLQLALAISASNSEFGLDPDKDQIRAATLLSLGRHQIGSRAQWNEAAESLSRRYWDYSILDYTEKVVDGFYDIYGLQTGPASQGKMPSLSDIQTEVEDSMFEVVMVNRAVDPALVELEQVAHCILLDCPSTNVELLVQRLADLVTDHMGGPVKDANIMLVRWMERIMELRNSLQTCVLPVGFLNVGLSRHRALLFKVLADNVGVPCRLVKGSHYTGIEDDAVNIVKLDHEREFLVDLMAAPGTLIPADILSTNDNSDFVNPLFSAAATSWRANVLADPLRPETSHDKNKGAYRKFVIDNGVMIDRKSSSESMDLPSVSSADKRWHPAIVGTSSNENTISAKQSHVFSSCQYKGSQQIPVVGNGVKEDPNAWPYSQDTVEDCKALFADLNPFQMAGKRETSVKPKSTENKDNDFHRWQERLASGPGRPPLPLAWKKRSACNEVPKTKQYRCVEGPLLENNQGKDYIPSYASSSSPPTEKLHSNVNISEFSGISCPLTSNSDGDSSSCGESELASTSNQLNEYGSDGDGKSDKVQISVQFPDRDHHYKNENILQNDIDDAHECGKSIANDYGDRKYSNDGVKGSGVIPGHFKCSSSTTVSHHGRVDSMLEDVAELEIPWEDLSIGERIGLGSYGEVYHAEWNGMEVAVKKFLDQDFSGDALDEFRSEVRIMRRLRHPNVVLFVGAVTRPPNLSIVTEFLPRGSLYRILHRPNCLLDEKRRIKMALDVAEGMNCLHTSRPTIVHRDLKSLNLLVDDNWNVKVCDFGLSRLKHNTFLSSKSTAGTPEWMAPEVLRNEPSNEKCDVFSFGVILWELATLRLPWTGMNQMQVVGAVGFQNRRLDVPKELDPLVATIIRECWQTDPNLRPSFAQLTTALKPLHRLVTSSHSDHQSMTLPQQMLVNSTP